MFEVKQKGIHSRLVIFTVIRFGFFPERKRERQKGEKNQKEGWGLKGVSTSRLYK